MGADDNGTGEAWAMGSMEPIGGAIPTEALVHAAYILTALAFLLRDILWLRLMAMAGNLCIAAAAFLASPGPAWAVAAWASTFFLINLGHSVWLIYERHLRHFTEEEQRLRDAAFQSLDPTNVRRLLRCGRWVEHPKEKSLTLQGVHLEDLVLISEGEAAVCLGGRVIHRLGCGKFVGEIGFLSGEPATATVVAASPLRCLTWKASELRRVLARHPEVRTVFHAAVGKDLAEKIAAHNVRLSTV